MKKKHRGKHWQRAERPQDVGRFFATKCDDWMAEINAMLKDTRNAPWVEQLILRRGEYLMLKKTLLSLVNMVSKAGISEESS